ncbi:glycosyltransferase [Brasilonema sp. UFV-L1]|nr:glycosyltransferase [Brasilonema sp. UFV-L1]NMG05962.1 glycosyltransferase family 2 protein [Brasilonema sp. UFV-L1]
MNVISRIRFPCTSETSSLYMRCNEGATINFCTEQKVELTRNGVLSLNTYFNSFYENFYAKYTKLSSLYYLLTLEGDFQVSLYREQYEREKRELIYTHKFDKCDPSEPIKVSLPDSWQSQDAGRAYLEITCLSERGCFTEGVVATEQPKIREVSLAIITCTFKKEVYIKNTVKTILQDDFLQDRKFKVFVVDNGRTLKPDEFGDSRVQLISNRNVGGAGGFTRGLIQALQEGVYTHFLFMDDDIELESESLYRLFPLYEYANQDFAISGSMLDLYKKHILYEAGALLCAKSLHRDGDYGNDPFAIVSLNNKLNLNNSYVTNNLLLEDNPDYGAFWFFSFSKTVVEEIGLPMPFFIKGDDIEFGLRITERLSKRIVAFPSIAVWHEPFYAKNPIWVSYYKFRNLLITHSIRGSLKYLDAVKFLTKGLIQGIFLFDYNSAEMIIKGLEDYMQGPALVKSTDAETLHAKILEHSKIHKNQTVTSYSSTHNLPQKNLSIENKNQPILKIILGLMTLNGHLVPNFLLSKDDVFYWIGSDSADRWFKVFAKKRVVISREGNNSVEQNEMSRSIGLGILIRWFKIVIKSRTKWSSVSSEWRNAFNHFSSTEFWKDYLKLNEQI